MGCNDNGVLPWMIGVQLPGNPGKSAMVMAHD